MTIGMLSKKCFEIVAIDHPEYDFWGKSKSRPAVMLKEFLGWVEMHYDVDFQHAALSHKQTPFLLSTGRCQRSIRPRPRKQQ